MTSAPAAMVGMYIADVDGTVVPAFKDLRVRQALNYAIDREAITKSVYGDFGIPTDQYVPEGIGGYLPELEDVYPYDPEKAKELLAEAGYPDGFSFTMLGQPGIDSGSPARAGDDRPVEGNRRRGRVQGHPGIRRLCRRVLQ